MSSYKTNPNDPVAAFLALVDATRLLPRKHQRWVLFLLTTPIPPHLLDWAEVSVDEHGGRAVVYTFSDGGARTTCRLRLSATAETILRPGAGPVLELLGLTGPVTGEALMKALALVFEEACGSDTVSVAQLHAAAICIARIAATGAAGVTADALITRGGFASA